MKHSPIPKRLWGSPSAKVGQKTRLTLLPDDLDRLFRASPAFADLAKLVQTILGTSLQADGSWAVLPAHHKRAMYDGARAALKLLED